jgi:hypothetical protein
MVLGEVEIRVLGVMIEKSLTQSSGYPMTVNAVTVGANQLQNRDPVVSISEREASTALRDLQHKGLAAQAPPSPGARVVRFEHRVVDRFHWDRRDQAVMAELMLRGRQTAGELRTHASRMTPLPELAAVTAILEGLKAHDPPFVEELPREPGRSANRFRHLLGAATMPTAAGATFAAPVTPTAGPVESLAARVARLESEVAELKAAVAALMKTRASDPSRLRTGIDAPPPPKV